MYKRIITLLGLQESFFLWGPRQTCKSQLLRSEFPTAKYIDLLLSDVLMKYLARPPLLREEILNQPRQEWIIIDEVQKILLLLNEVQWLIENHKQKFILCCSSATKLKRGQANLLGDRALRRQLLGMSAKELDQQFDLLRMLNHG